MTDKQIIIDGVDVSGCRCLAYPEADNPMCTGLYLGCKNNNCDYKRYQRAEKQLAEDEEIQVDMRIKIDELKGLLSNKEQEYEVLKKLAGTHLAETINMEKVWNKIQSLRKHEQIDEDCPSEHWLFGGEE